ncbi:MAG: type II toxin-antitoxin system mRNA interferase toxin, RelE/StbE family [bacterium]|nr:type II toxin-antitoxin system mRNA interferase toxin, RelE/StbE family [bacterium]
MKLFRTKIFKKDYRKLKMTDTQYAKYVKFLSILLDGKELPLEARNHNLIGNYHGFKEFHKVNLKLNFNKAILTNGFNGDV